LGAPAEFETRSPFGLVGFKSLYGATFKEFVPLKIGDVPAALKSASIDCGNLFSTMSVISTDQLVPLEDDKTIVAHEAVVPLIRKSALTPDVAKVLDSVSSKLDTETLKQLMVKIEVDKQAPDKVAEAYVATLAAP
ncbi:MAG: glycine betaine ABC transporter substrate-binding protein, partial [Ilumatobacteraceae bacterium]